MYDCNHLSRDGGGQSGEGGYEMCPKELGGDRSHMALQATLRSSVSLS